MVPRTEDKAEWIGLCEAKRLCSPPHSLRGSHNLCHFTAVGCQWLQIRRSVLVAGDRKSPLSGGKKKTKENRMELEQRGFRFYKINTFFTVWCRKYWSSRVRGGLGPSFLEIKQWEREEIPLCPSWLNAIMCSRWHWLPFLCLACTFIWIMSNTGTMSLGQIVRSTQLVNQSCCLSAQ